MKRYYADKTSLRLLRVVILGFTGLLTFVLYLVLRGVPRLLLPVIWAVLALGISFACVYLPLYFKNVLYYVSGTELVKHSGLFFRRRQTMRCSAVQYTTAIRTPFSKVTGLNFLVLHALGGQLILTFLSHKDLEDILRTVRE